MTEDTLKRVRDATEQGNRRLGAAQDDFNNFVTRGTVNTEDLPSDKPMSPERFRLFNAADGGDESNRVFLQYGEGGSLFTDQEDSYLLTPNADQALTFRTGRRYRYVVGFINEWSNAFGLSRELESGEYVEVMIDYDGSGSDGHGIALRSDDEYLFERRDGSPGQDRSQEAAAVDTDILNNGTTFARFESRYTWYNVGPARMRQNYREGNDIKEQDLGSVAADPGQGSRYSLGHITFRVHREPGTDPLNVEVGSMGYNVQGDVTATGRTKGAVVGGLSHSGSGDWEPLAALRIKPGFRSVPCSIERVAPISGPTGELAIIAVSSTNTDASGWVSRGDNTAVEYTTSITEFPDSTGTRVTSVADIIAGGNGYGGYQLALASTEEVGAGAQQQTTGTDRVVLTPLYPNDVGVVVGRASSAGDFRGRIDVNQEW